MAGNPKLIILSEQLRGQTFELTADQYSVGRAEDCDICIPDPTMSGHHCDLRRDGDGVYSVVDLESTNGTRVNGVRVQSQRLNNSDIMQIGGVEVLFDSHEKFVTSVLSTQTKINLEDTAGDLNVQEMSNFSPFGSRSSALQGTEKSKWVTIAIYGGIGVLAAAVLVAIVVLIVKIVGS